MSTDTRSCTNRWAIAAVKTATNPMPTTITKIAIARPAVVRAATSPYPTVVMVPIDHQMPSDVEIL